MSAYTGYVRHGDSVTYLCVRGQVGTSPVVAICTALFCIIFYRGVGINTNKFSVRAIAKHKSIAARLFRQPNHPNLKNAFRKMRGSVFLYI